MKQIALTQNQFAIVDDEDYDRIVSFNSWCASTHQRRKTFYAVSSRVVNGKCKLFRMHRLIMGVDDPHVFVDHIDGNGLNNQKSNLRICSKFQNQQNRPKNKNNSSGHKGVHRDKARDKWAAKIMVNRKNIALGRFDNLQAAVDAYKTACEKYHGEYSNIG